MRPGSDAGTASPVQRGIMSEVTIVDEVFMLEVKMFAYTPASLIGTMIPVGYPLRISLPVQALIATMAALQTTTKAIT